MVQVSEPVLGLAQALAQAPEQDWAQALVQEPGSEPAVRSGR